LEWLQQLKELGYQKFKVVRESSGSIAYGETAIDIKTSNKWRSYDDVFKDWKQYGYDLVPRYSKSSIQ
jgi:hypothetical protein